MPKTNTCNMENKIMVLYLKFGLNIGSYMAKYYYTWGLIF